MTILSLFSGWRFFSSLYFFFFLFFGLISFCSLFCCARRCNSTLLLCERSLLKKEEWICLWFSESCFEFFTQYLLLYISLWLLKETLRSLMNVDSSFGRSETDFVDKLGPLVILCFFFFFFFLRSLFVPFLSAKNWIYLFF